MAADVTQQAILEKLEALQKQVREQQLVIDQLKTKLTKGEQVTDEAVTDMVRDEVDKAVQEGLAQVKDGPRLSLPKQIDGLSLKGDMRLRYEYRAEENDSSSGDSDSREKSRLRTRLRLGGVWKNSSESWEIGAGLATGGYGSKSDSSIHKQTSSGKSTNASWNGDGVWETAAINLDYAYAKHTWEDFSLTLGQHKNPYTSTYIMFDGDLRPTGATAQYGSGPLFATLGAYNLRSDDGLDNDQTLASMYAVQVGTKMETEGVEGVLAVALYTYDDETTEWYVGRDDEDDSYAYQIGDIYGSIGTKVGDVGLTAYAQFAKNFGADNGDLGDTKQPGSGSPAYPAYDAESNDQAWVLGLEAKYDRLKLSYSYAHIEGDAVPWFMTDSDFGAAIPGSDISLNVEGHKIGVEYKLTKNCAVAATAMLTELIEENGSSDKEGELYQFDLKYKF